MKEYELECGCSGIVINGKFITFVCDEHEEELQNLLDKPSYTKQTKMRLYREI